MRVDVTPFGEARELEAVADRSDNLRPALENAADAIRSLFGDVFTSRGAAAGVVWARPTDGYARRKRAAKPGAPQGVFTGLLRDSVTRRRSRYSVERITADKVTVETKAPHAHLFEKGRGGQRGRRLTPSRRRIEQAGAEVLTAHLTGRKFTGLL